MSEGSERKNAACYECDFEPLLLLDLQDSRSAPHEAVGGSGCISHSAVSLCIDLTVSQGLDSTQLMNLCKNYVSLFFICFFFFSNLKKKKKLQKRERTCRAYMKVLEQSFCPLCLLPPPHPLPSSIPVQLYPPRPQVQQHVPSVPSCTPLLPVLSAFFYLFIFLILPYTETQSQPKVLFFFFFSKSKRSHLQLLRRLLDMDVSLCAPHLLYALAAMVFCLFVCFSLCLFYFYFFFLLCVFKCLLKIARLYA